MAKTTVYIALALGAQEPAYPAYVAFRSPFRFVSGATVVLPEPSPVALAEDGTGTVAVDPGVWLVDEILPTQVFRRAVIVPESTGVVQYANLVEVTNPVELGYGPSWAALAQQAALAAAMSREDVLEAIAGLAKGEPLGIATLDESGTVPEDQMPARLSPASLYAIVGQLLTDQDIPGQIVAAIAAAGTVEDAAVTAIENAASGLDVILASDPRIPQNNPSPDEKLSEVWVDANMKALFGVDVPRGVIYAAFLESIGISVTGGVSAASVTAPLINGITDVPVSNESGLLFGYMDSNERLWEPTLVDLDGRHPQWVLDRMAARMNIPGTLGYKTTYGPDQDAVRKFVSGPDLVTWGTSMGAGAGGSGYTVGSEVAALTGLTHRNGSVGGENTSTIGARNGSNPFLFVLAGGQLPASGPVAVTWRLSGDNPGGWPFLQGAGTGESAVAGVAGTLHLTQLDGSVVKVPGKFSWIQDPVNAAATDGRQWQHSGNDVYYFTRDTPGGVVPAPRPSPFLYAFGEARRGDINLYWAIRNNNLQSDANRQMAYDFIERSIRHQAALNPRYIIIGEALGGSYPAGERTALDANLVAGDNAYNAYMQNKYGRRFIDIHKYLVEFGLSDWGLTPTADDTWDMQNNRVPRSLRIDGTHFNQYGYRSVGRLVVARMREFGWVA